MITRLDGQPETWFPPVGQAMEDPDGLLAVGGRLSPERLLAGYRQGIFPWYIGGEPVLWWSPGERCVLRTSGVHVSRRLARTLRQGRFEVTADCAFSAVIDACAVAREETWITPEMRAAYCELHRLGWAHSVEVWRDGRLVGGIYGPALGRVFFGESMFSAEPDASKVALVALCRVLDAWGFPLLDCQLPNPHLERMGAHCMSRDDFVAHLDRFAGVDSRRGSWQQDFAETQRAGNYSTRK